MRNSGPLIRQAVAPCFRATAESRDPVYPKSYFHMLNFYLEADFLQAQEAKSG